MKRRHDPVRVVESAYDAVDSPTAAWLQHIADAASSLDSGFGVVVGLFDSRNIEQRSMEVAMTRAAPPELRIATREVLRGLPPDVLAGMHAFGAGFAEDRAPGRPEMDRVPGTAPMTRIGIQGAFGIVGIDAGGHGIMISAPTPVPRQPGMLPLQPWRRVAAHLGTAVRLRARLAHLRSEPDAVLLPNGLVVHASGEARAAAGRRQLGTAVRLMDRARTRRGREDAAQALALWNALVAGRWSLVDTYESDGKRTLVAHRNDAPAVAARSGLAPREGQVAGLVAGGRSNKEIAYELGIGSSTVETLVLRVRRKLGVPSRAALAGAIAAQAR